MLAIELTPFLQGSLKNSTRLTSHHVFTPKREETQGERERELRTRMVTRFAMATIQLRGYCSKNGRKYAHVCSHYDLATKEICQKNHVRTNNHK
jgi:hypothetical protein